MTKLIAFFKPSDQTKQFLDLLKKIFHDTWMFFLVSILWGAILWAHLPTRYELYAVGVSMSMCLMTLLIGAFEQTIKRKSSLVDTCKELIASYEDLSGDFLESLELARKLRAQGAADSAYECEQNVLDSLHRIVQNNKIQNNKRDEAYKRAGLLNSKV